MTTLRLHRVRWTAWLALLVAGAAQGWYFRHEVSPDGVAYLDLSDAVVHGRLGDLVNGYWSPLYPFAVGVTRWLVSATPLRSPYWEFPLLHFVAFAGFALSIAAFEWFLDSLDRASATWNAFRPFTSPVGRALAYVLFATASLVMISVEGTLPDFLLSAATFAAFACALRLLEHPEHKRHAVILGVILAGGALSKSFMFPLSAVLLAIIAVRQCTRATWSAVVLAGMTFLLATLPWCLALSVSLGKPSTGQTGALNYAWYVNDIQPPNTGVMPRLAVRADLPLDGIAVLSAPKGTNPLWFDPARWHRDVQPAFAPAQQWTHFVISSEYFLGILGPLLVLLAGALVALRWRDARTVFGRAAPIVVPSLAAFFAYALVYATARYVAPFLVAGCLAVAAAMPRDAVLRPSRLVPALALSALLLDALSPVRGRVFVAYAAAFVVMAFCSIDGSAGRRWTFAALAAAAGAFVLLFVPVDVARALVLLAGVACAILLTDRERHVPPGDAATMLRAVAAVAVIALLIPNAIGGWHAARRWADVTRGDASPDWTTAQRYIREGITPGSRIAIVGDPTDAGWARLARYQIVGVVPPYRAAAFAALSEAARQRILRAFVAAGASQLIVRGGE